MVESTVHSTAKVTCRACGEPLPIHARTFCSPSCQEQGRVERVRAQHRRRKERPSAADAHSLTLPSSLYGPDRYGTVVAGGFGVRLNVEDAHLVVATRDHGERRFSRVSPLRRLVVVGTSGTLSLLALWWCREVEVDVTVIEPSGRLLTIVLPDARNDARLRRAQATAPWTAAGLAIALELTRRKLDGYRGVIAQLPESSGAVAAGHAVESALVRLPQMTSLNVLRQLEANTGFAYHAALAPTPVPWAQREVVPEHWRTLGQRSSKFGRGARGAVTPGQALRNFLGGVAAANIAVACRTVGLDPGIGIGLHHDIRGRDSHVWEVMEAVRPGLDALNLELLQSRVWRRGDFYELPTGEVRLRPDWPAIRPDRTAAARALVAEATRRVHALFRKDLVVATTVEMVATLVAKHALEPPGTSKTSVIQAPTVLSGASRIRARQAEQRLVVGTRSL